MAFEGKKYLLECNFFLSKVLDQYDFIKTFFKFSYAQDSNYLIKIL